jgi:hypothetical protein
MEMDNWKEIGSRAHWTVDMHPAVATLSASADGEKDEHLVAWANGGSQV